MNPDAESCRASSSPLRQGGFWALAGQSLRTCRHLSRLWRIAVGACLLLSVACALYPTDHAEDYAQSRGGEHVATVVFVEEFLRHANTAAAILLPIVHRDGVGLAQLAVVTVVGTAATHGAKRLLNDVEVAGTRLGQRPLRPDSRHNAPSGHSSLASAAAFFVCRRYGWAWSLMLMPITWATMWARVQLDAHTWSAVLSGLFLGAAVVICCVTVRRASSA